MTTASDIPSSGFITTPEQPTRQHDRAIPAAKKSTALRKTARWHVAGLSGGGVISVCHSKSGKATLRGVFGRRRLHTTSNEYVN